MLPTTLFFGLVALGATRSAAQPAARSIHEMDDPALAKLDLAALANPVSAFHVPADLVSPGLYASSQTTKARTPARSADTTITTAVCLQTHNEPTDSDCKSICSSFNATNDPKSLTLQPRHFVTFELGNCAYSVGNLETCKNVTFAPYTWLGALCHSMESHCAVEEFDAYVQYASPQTGMILSAKKGAPPFGPTACN